MKLNSTHNRAGWSSKAFVGDVAAGPLLQGVCTHAETTVRSTKRPPRSSIVRNGSGGSRRPLLSETSSSWRRFRLRASGRRDLGDGAHGRGSSPPELDLPDILNATICEPHAKPDFTRELRRGGALKRVDVHVPVRVGHLFDQFARGEARTYDKTSGRQLAERIKSCGRAARAKKR
jgi:hypothetical protein